MSSNLGKRCPMLSYATYGKDASDGIPHPNLNTPIPLDELKDPMSMCKVKNEECTESTIERGEFQLNIMKECVTGLDECTCADKGYTEKYSESLVKAFYPIVGVGDIIVRNYAKPGDPLITGKLFPDESLASQTSPSITSVLAVVLMGFFVGSGVTYAVVRFCKGSSPVGVKPLLA